MNVASLWPVSRVRVFGSFTKIGEASLKVTILCITGKASLF